ncbi:phytase [Thalassoglobus polymorphus]|uniref:3-phytase n=1 Tax=Thalassoglobus polymorphus TaxID=2527994 RepID=A0A517QN16_9PLAN|nr:phytase [Thalassoglobus polymorphus]QDT32957.1 3-phytase precursor [Thalassoglobus polymorphus]
MKSNPLRKILPVTIVAFALPAMGLTQLVFAHDGDEEHEHEHQPPTAEVREVYKPTLLPDRIVLTWTGDPATSQAVTWRTSTQITQGIAEIAKAEAGPGFPAKAVRVNATSQALLTNLSTAHYHTVEFQDLQPKTKYAYRVGDGVNWSEWFHFTTASSQPEPFSFIYFGDAQNDVRSMWSRVIREAYGDAPEAAFMLHAGDLVNRAEADHEWGEWFGAGNWVNAMVPSIAVPGNHEQAKLPDGSRRLSHHWRPTFAFPENGPPGLEESCYTLVYQGVRIIGLNSNHQQEDQAVWLDKVLSENECQWVVCTFHHPMHSTGKDRDNSELRALWKPVLDEHQVDLVLQGHDHTYGRTGLKTPRGLPQTISNVPTGVSKQDEATGTVYVVSVSGPKMYSLQPHPFMVRTAEDTQLYQIITIDGNELRYEARTAVGKLYDAFTLHKKEGEINELIDQIPETPERRRVPEKPAPNDETKQSMLKSNGVPVVEPSMRLLNPEAVDQDDLCIWRHPVDPALSTIITSDKSANRIFVYDLEGKLLSSHEVAKPGNIDIRGNFPLAGNRVDLVVANQRDDGERLVAFRVDPKTRELVRVDRGDLMTGPNYGGCLYHSLKTDRFYFFSTSEEAGTVQFELKDDGDGQVISTKVRTLPLGKSEGAVADDQSGIVYIAEEEKGIWKVGAEPGDSTTGELVVTVGQDGIQGDLEGVTLTAPNEGDRFLVFSDQGASTMHVLPLDGSTTTKRFTIDGVKETDGIDLTMTPLGDKYPNGIFACHSDEDRCPIVVTPIERIHEALHRE